MPSACGRVSTDLAMAMPVTRPHENVAGTAGERVLTPSRNARRLRSDSRSSMEIGASRGVLVRLSGGIWRVRRSAGKDRATRSDPARIERETLPKTRPDTRPETAAPSLESGLVSRLIKPTAPDGGLSDVPHGLLSNHNFDCILRTSRDGERRIIAS